MLQTTPKQVAVFLWREGRVVAILSWYDRATCVEIHEWLFLLKSHACFGILLQKWRPWSSRRRRRKKLPPLQQRPPTPPPSPSHPITPLVSWPRPLLWVLLWCTLPVPRSSFHSSLPCRVSSCTCPVSFPSFWSCSEVTLCGWWDVNSTPTNQLPPPVFHFCECCESVQSCTHPAPFPSFHWALLLRAECAVMYPTYTLFHLPFPTPILWIFKIRDLSYICSLLPLATPVGTVRYWDMQSCTHPTPFSSFHFPLPCCGYLKSWICPIYVRSFP